MDNRTIKNFFDKAAPTWDAEMIKDIAITGTILDNANIEAGNSVLDVACGTGVLFDDYISRNVKSITGIDLSSEMIKHAQAKYSSNPQIELICGDAQVHNFASSFDRIVIYNAFPHFTDPERLIYKLSSYLNIGGILTVAHGMSRAAINSLHTEKASSISNGLITSSELAAIFTKYLEVTVNISNDQMYQVCGIKKL